VEPGPPDRHDVARNLAAVQRAWDAWNAKTITVDGIRRGDLKPVLEVFDRGIVWDVTEVGVPGLGTYFGHRGVRQFWIDWFEVVGNVHTNVVETRAAGDKVISICVQTGSGIASGATVMWEFAMVFTMRHGKVVRTDMYPDLDEAREIAGVADLKGVWI
jgi:ketosteroid isomerase-like protein